MAQCQGIRRDGGRCTLSVPAGVQWCFNHDPTRAEERRRNAARAGRSKPSRELSGIKAQLQDLVEDVLTGNLETGRGAVANQLINTRLRAIEVERKVKEAEEIEERITRLEDLAGRQRKPGGTRWGT
jgi:hypothetical protein